MINPPNRQFDIWKATNIIIPNMQDYVMKNNRYLQSHFFIFTYFYYLNICFVW